MAYSQTGLIEADDYNAFAQRTLAIWGTPANNSSGYGQTGTVGTSTTTANLANVSASAGTISATQWATLIGTVNACTRHQTGANALSVTLPTVGDVVTFYSTLSASVTAIETNKDKFNSVGTTTTGTTVSGNLQAAYNADGTMTVTRTATFPSQNAMRAFFNAGGQLQFEVVSATNNNSTSRSTSAVNLANTIFKSKVLRAANCGARTGTGGTITSDVTNTGFRSLTGTLATVYQGSEASGVYTASYARLQASATTTTVTMSFVVFMDQPSGTYDGTPTADSNPFTAPGVGQPPTTPTDNSQPGNDALAVTVNYRMNVIYPETTNLTDAPWGTVSVA